MIRGTTPGYELTVIGADLRDCTVYVTIAQGENRHITLSGERLTITGNLGASKIVFCMTQRESLTFRSGRASVQVKFMDRNNNVNATNIGDIKVLPILNEDVI